MASPSPGFTRGSTRWPTAIADRLDALQSISPSPAARSTASRPSSAARSTRLVLGLATGEAMAHLRHLEVEGRAPREVRDGVYWYNALEK